MYNFAKNNLRRLLELQNHFKTNILGMFNYSRQRIDLSAINFCAEADAKRNLSLYQNNT